MTNDRETKINRIKRLKLLNSTLVLENEKNKELFRFYRGKLIEYNLVKYNGRTFGLNDEERKAIKKFSCTSI